MKKALCRQRVRGTAGDEENQINNSEPVPPANYTPPHLHNTEAAGQETEIVQLTYQSGHSTPSGGNSGPTFETPPETRCSTPILRYTRSRGDPEEGHVELDNKKKAKKSTWVALGDRKKTKKEKKKKTTTNATTE